MDPMLAVILTRAAERFVVVLAGIMSIYIGYRLFALIPNHKEGESRITFPGGFSFFASRIGPGVFFALFGACLIGYSATKPVSLDQPRVADGNGDNSGTKYIGFGPDKGEADGPTLPQGSADRADVITYLNVWFRELPPDLESKVKIDRAIAVKESKLALMREVWDSGAWGDYATFHNWVVLQAQTGPVPTGSQAAAELFDKGSK